MNFRFGPGALVAAAFIGPGTVTACTLAGAQFGYALIWALLFATFATLVLQDMAVRLGAGAGLGLGEALMKSVAFAPLRVVMALLIFVALAVGNGAYEAGNLAGAALGLEAILGPDSEPELFSVLAVAVTAGLLLWRAHYKFLERALVTIVLVMSLAFLISAVLVRPDWVALAGGLIPTVPPGGLLTAIALIGTTVVPYNLFLHAAAARKKWGENKRVSEARADSLFSIGLGGLVSILIVATAAASFFESGLVIDNAASMARSLEPVFGSGARYLIGFGLLAAGLTSAITAPMATAYALNEIWPPSREHKLRRFRIIALAVLLAGLTINLLGLQPVRLILLAQFANGLLLPLMAAFLLWVMNRRAMLESYANGRLANVAGAAVLMLTCLLSARVLGRALGLNT